MTHSVGYYKRFTTFHLINMNYELMARKRALKVEQLRLNEAITYHAEHTILTPEIVIRGRRILVSSLREWWKHRRDNDGTD